MAKVQVSPRAQDDLVATKTYIEHDLCSPRAALTVIAQITKRLRELRKFPDLGASLDSFIDIHTDYRFLVCDSYTVFYRHVGEEVFVDRILYGKRDFMKILFGAQ
ncbi:MAG: type II toxin-antitoxin system RelE/ParE family toxin [Coriobacteriia bacterium]|nr:type II toxin-antitoxin system RelE/ParE family toxin [Coriobacteriia bacterium]